MFFKTKRNRRKTTRQTLSTEQLEPKAMFNATAFETQICFEDRLGSSDMDTNDIVLQVKNVALDVGPVNQAGDNGCMIVHPTFRGGGTAGPGGSASLRSENRFVFETPKTDPLLVPAGYDFANVDPERLAGSASPGGDDVFMPKPNRGVSLHDSVHCLVGDIGKAPFTTGAGGDSIVHPEFMTGVNSLAQANQQPQIANVWTNGNATSMAPRPAAFARMGR